MAEEDDADKLRAILATSQPEKPMDPDAARLEQIRRGQQQARSLSLGGGSPLPDRDRPLVSAWPYREGQVFETVNRVFMATAITQLGRLRYGPDWEAPQTEREEVGRDLIARAADGYPLAFCRGKSEGGFAPLGSSYFQTDQWRALVEACAVRVSGSLGKREAWIFFDGDQLAGLLVRPEWAPLPDEQIKAWITDRRWETEMNDRLKASRKQLTDRGAGRVLFEMWRVYRADGTVRSIRDAYEKGEAPRRG